MELVVEGVRSGYPGLVAVDGVDLRVPPGRVVAIVGPNGCGKSTLLRGMARIHKPLAGRITVGGHDIWRLRPRQAAHHVTLLPQSPVSPEGITVAGLVAYGRHPHQGLFRQWSREDERIAAESMAATGVTGLAGRRVDQLSGGQRQRCWLAMVLAQQTPVTLLDEPTSALDLGHQVEVLELVRSVARGGRTVVMVLHDIASAARYADVLVAMRSGKVVASGAPKDVVDSALIRELYDVDADILAAPGDGAPLVVPSATSTVPAADAEPGRVNGERDGGRDDAVDAVDAVEGAQAGAVADVR
ncbi:MULTISPECIES: ABC transporter ATP-binding protein [Actinomadura]|uniref:ABC transporter ATP-binding protein n=1 Tax=Actinomadura yumaensis TaxID=111807 RepID=A0ABW2CZD0_9ACTN|nr:ABC transporter ATP-binding protein [Actinomadura sp. J1-007]MWK40213.1 ATP-binding cassette domain-containing protein [Actinomadura sp. J1-007]